MYRNFVLGFGVARDYFGWKKAVSLFPPRVLHGFVHAGKIPAHLSWMQEQTSLGHSPLRGWRGPLRPPSATTLCWLSTRGDCAQARVGGSQSPHGGAGYCRVCRRVDAAARGGVRVGSPAGRFRRHRHPVQVPGAGEILVATLPLRAFPCVHAHGSQSASRPASDDADAHQRAPDVRRLPSISY